VAAAWRALYRQGHRQLLVRRLRWCAGLGSLGALFQVVQSALLGGPTVWVRFGFALAYGAVSLAAWALTWVPSLRRRATGSALVYVLALIAVLAENYTWLPRDAGLAPAGFVAVMIGTMVLLPWGAVPQAVIGVGTLAGYAWVLVRAPGGPDFSAAGLVLSMFVVAVTAAELIERYRAQSFERTWQQAQLVSLARELAAEVESSEVIARVLEHALRLVPAELVGVTLRDAPRRLYRTESMAGPLAQGGSWAIGFEIPEDFAPVQEIVARGMLVLPEDDPASTLVPILVEHEVRHGLYVALRYGGEVVGIINFARRDAVPFTAGERLLARGLADQAALALRTARLVSELRLANRSKSEFVSTMSHELRTPLNVMLGYAEMVDDPELDAGARREAVERIKKAGVDLLELIENTLEVGKIEAGRGEPRLEAVDFPAFWVELGHGCARMRRPRSVALEWDAAAPAVALETDPRKLAVVIRNLVSNALKFTEKGSVHAEARLEDGDLVVRVADTGIGIRREHHETIFEMFRQADQSDTRRHEGTGLGLYIVQRFVAQLGGTVTVESAPGHGSVFAVRLSARNASPLGVAA